ncbi:hypothetical protein MRS76_00895 [Rhizobiaceae bacterium n13]|uniref:Nuclease n=1 Tax=Ferirhizobium litorale TaxID=2927786 RepID=A0AAE3Q995_9HYPH|nr:hypothetical protein [Fererhizobium litorale]MDI7860500.1 hypothetical protein [Fererhizobium litorale]MDI7920635.1 hypothetical protein [Fererhizobium litorale]
MLSWTLVALLVVGGILTYEHYGKRPAETRVAAAGADRSSHRKVVERQGAAERKRPSSLPTPPVPVRTKPANAAFTASIPRAPVPDHKPAQQVATAGVFKTAFGYCGQGAPRNCVVDGGTFWHQGVKIRIAGIDTPALEKAACEQERQLGFKAKVRLLHLLNEGPVGIEGSGDGNGGARTIRREGRSVGDILVSEGLAQPASGRHRPWC